MRTKLVIIPTTTHPLEGGYYTVPRTPVKSCT
jgi:hypothetical protein